MWVKKEDGSLFQICDYGIPCPCRFDFESLLDVANAIGLSENMVRRLVIPPWNTVFHDWLNHGNPNYVDQSLAEKMPKRRKGRPIQKFVPDAFRFYLIYEKGQGSSRSPSRIHAVESYMRQNELDFPGPFPGEDGPRKRKRQLRDKVIESMNYYCTCTHQQKTITPLILSRLAEVPHSTALGVYVFHFEFRPDWLARQIPGVTEDDLRLTIGLAKNA